MRLLFFIIIVAALVLFLVRKLQGASTTGALPYARKGQLFTKAERSFYGVLKQAVGDRYEIFGHVRLADLLTVKKGLLSNGQRQSAQNKIQSKHCDFVLCDPGDLSIVAGIELDDSSHRAAKRIERDNFINQAFKEAELPLLRIKARASYSSREIAMQLQKALGLSLEQKLALPTQQSEPVITSPDNAQAPKFCPKCSSAMVRKKATKGKYAGTYFLACTAYPVCKTVIPLKVASQ
ncbi:MAG: topoisomerase [Zetaproteobacteria bacterium CG12_big_fil_rev_8_21_14_0_65_55_1124]|nr:MAG: hypothetical protein AUJ58_06500 [Zetaproteobacteria bacterium CG1_02_55_237]PIS18953.1 MAG: topoisomerase [Zetaproteobacteria bacterium CG08_land_8_20_14_0_20_55_17]PIW42156.1 MAG: topoisomerase [Zetaproteobacteria bacterium CG12_big_fil_rev_8_21_14_0_65_55_1124]PIY54362.1 MAG: topoisomerase [Zetaproteobacteria bacterium CG_4_10_14_0_8_um_filter_55_43]PIZ38906.1 MAG: topoisomerase [Zetaproteobacteria bacterium CG_4_10_14_0_2_um_filter_55_20]PJB82856.1 MAG: topoisomerase [Zetaproteobac